ncbi:DUF3817 domain-containing protein [Allosaccharopolyspora coralli]|uniref:DUF3817 domain-containing protein n=1 Tax=Allosaccharopolyspora coralli TaxID=2665642 RepID=A0A5Q3Q9J9_9PSEU|nr:DUF3817 domain-containing protein [Allosaccharopolyspora coralli]QGK71142.1 DUF3817 domain-containing protein [Allosaccharopolyspora coralli]
MPRTYGEWFRVAAVAEALSWAGLLVAMAFKYGLDMPLGVTIFGWIHGAVFTAYLVTTFVVFSPLRWSFGVLVLAGLASIPPLVTVWFERWARRRGLLEVRDADEPTFWQRVRALN